MTNWTGFLGASYPWVLAAHITFVIYWVAGLLLLPRYYVYHQETPPGTAEDRAWIERERRTRRIILDPSLVAAWILGLLLAVNIDAFSQGWFSAKLALVIGLTVYQLWLWRHGKALAAGKRAADSRGLRIMNEIPGIAAAVIVVLVIVRPF